MLFSIILNVILNLFQMFQKVLLYAIKVPQIESQCFEINYLYLEKVFFLLL